MLKILYILKTFFCWCNVVCVYRVMFESSWNYIHLSRRWRPKWSPTKNGVSFESAQQDAYTNATLQDQIWIFKSFAKPFLFFFKKQDWKTHVQYRTIKFQKRWTSVEIKTVKTQTKQQHVTSVIALFKMKHVTHMMVLWITICDRSSYCSVISY